MLASISGDGKSILLALNPKVNTQVQLADLHTISQYHRLGTRPKTFDIKLPDLPHRGTRHACRR